MYDLRILMIWIILGFLLYLITIRPDRSIQAGEKIVKDAKQRSGKSEWNSGHQMEQSDRVLVKKLQRISDIKKFNRKKHAPTMHLNGIIPFELVSNLGVIPLKIEEDVLILAMIDPFDFNAIDIIRSVTGLKIQPVKIAVKDFKSIIN